MPTMAKTRNMKSLIHVVLLTFLTAIFSLSLVAQNQQDANGKKQGHWKITNATKRLPGYNPDQVVEEGDYKDSRKVGVWITYYSNGKKKSEITYASGRPNGPYTTYYSNGNVEEQGNWSRNRNTGNFKRYHENGKVSQEFNFSETGKREGTQKYYYDNGQLMIEGDWNGGKESGTLTEYYENGEVKAKKVFADGALDEAKTQNFKPKKPVVDQEKKEEEDAPARNVVANNKKEKPNTGHFDGNGYAKLYNQDRLITKDGIFKNYKLIDGKWYKYDENNILINIERIKNGRYVGDVPFDEE